MIDVASQSSKTSIDFFTSRIDEGKINVKIVNLITLLVLTSVAVWLGNNLLLQNIEIAVMSLKILLFSTSIILSMFVFSVYINSIQWGFVGVIILLLSAVYLKITYLSYFFYFVGFAGLVLLVVSFARSQLSLFTAVVLSIFSALVIMSYLSYEQFDMLGLLNNGTVHRDTLFHASIASMIKTYGITSTGLNGLVETPYHFLSHAIIASFSLLTELPVYESYGIINAVLFAPLIIFSCSYVAYSLSDNIKISNTWLSVSVVIFASSFLFSGWGVFVSYFTSESYLLSLSLLLLSLQLISGEKLSNAEWLCFTLLVLLSAMAKASVGIILIGLFLSRIIFITKGKNKIVELSLWSIIALGVFFIVFLSAKSAAGSISIQPFNFTIYNSVWGGQLNELFHCSVDGIGSPCVSTYFKSFVALLTFVFFHFIISWLALYFKVKQYGFGNLFSNSWMLYSLGSLVFGLFIVSVFELQDGSMFYFTNVAMFVSLPLLVTFLASLSIGKHFKLGLGIGGCIIIISNYSHLIEWWEQRIPLVKKDNVIQNKLVMTLLNHRYKYNDNTYLKFSDNYSHFNDNPMVDCRAKPFVLPAITELAWLGALEEDGNCKYSNYGFVNYESGLTKHGIMEFNRSAKPDGINVVIIKPNI